MAFYADKEELEYNNQNIRSIIISNEKDPLISITPIIEPGQDAVIQTYWEIKENSRALVESYEETIKQIECFPKINYEVIIGSMGVGGIINRRTIPSNELAKVINPFSFTNEEDCNLEIHSNYGAIMFSRGIDYNMEGIKKGAKHITVLSPIHLGSLISKLTVTSKLIRPKELNNMEDILERTYNLDFCEEEYHQNTPLLNSN